MRYDTPRLHRVWHETLIEHPLFDDHLGVCESAIDGRVIDSLTVRAHAGSARYEGNGKVIRKPFVDDRGLTGHRELRIDDGRKRIVGHHDRVRRIASDISIRRNDYGNGFACESHDVGRNRAMFGGGKWCPDGHWREELRDLRAKQEGLLNGYGWVNKEGGVARIPIDEAMRMVVEKGLPVRESQK